MMELWVIGVLLLIGGAVGYGVGLIARENQNKERRLRDLEKKVGELEDRRSHPYPTRAGLEDGMAIVQDVLEEMEASRTYAIARISQLNSKLRTIRADPFAYVEDSTNGKIPYERRGITKKKGD